MLANMIRQSKNITGISIEETENKISQHTDDTEIMLEGDKNSFEGIIQTTDTFGEISGLFLNARKTRVTWLGNTRNSPIRYMPHLYMGWNPPRTKFMEFGLPTV